MERATPEHPSGLVTSAQRGDADAATALYRHYFPHVYGYLLIALKNHFDAEDASQHVFLKVFEALPRYRRGAQPFSAWLFTLVRNHAIDRLRTLGRAEPTDPHEINDRLGAASAGSAPDPAGERRDIALMLADLPPLQRRLLTMLYLHDLKATEAARLLGREPDAVRQMHRRALNTLSGKEAGARHAA